jgi:hypothetical protein
MVSTVRFESVDSVARRTHSDKTTVRRWVRDGLVPFKRLPSAAGGSARLRIQVDDDGFPVRLSPPRRSPSR